MPRCSVFQCEGEDLNLHGSYPASTSTQCVSKKPRRFSLASRAEGYGNLGATLPNWETPGRARVTLADLAGVAL
jgi:hypothetical protein